jgi:hypothetical protein
MLFFTKWKKGSVHVKVIFRRVRVAIVAVENKKYYMFWACVCSLIYAACKAHAPYYIVTCGLCGCTIFFHIIS